MLCFQHTSPACRTEHDATEAPGQEMLGYRYTLLSVLLAAKETAFLLDGNAAICFSMDKSELTCVVLRAKRVPLQLAAVT